MSAVNGPGHDSHELAEARVAPALAPAAVGVDGARPGTVYLLGGGPGDPGLVSLRAAAILSTCDVVAYDRLAPQELLVLAPDAAERICVGKTVDRPGWTQDEINRLIVSEAVSGKAVARLKGGDPFVFGRGGEEALACRASGVPVEVVSGVSSAIAAPAAAGVPVTHRAVATGVAFITGHETEDKPDSQIDWEALARFHGTLVFLMGVGNVGSIATSLVAHGRPPATPVAVVRWGTTREQVVLTTDLASVADDIRWAGISSPAAIVVGDVVALRDQLGDLAPLAASQSVPIPA